MYACDFEYDGLKLSDFGFIVCEFDGSNGTEIANAGSEITFITTPIHSGKRYVRSGTKYDKCLSTTFQICKDPDTHNEDELALTDDEFRALSRWLNRREYLWFHSFDGEVTTRPYFRASFNLKRIEIGKVTYGVELDMVTDAPFGYGEEETVSLSFSAGALSKTFDDLSDDIGEIYPKTTIQCSSSGDLVLTNDITGCSFEVDDCVSGETISLSGDTMIITSSLQTHDIANSFNYDFFRFGNTYDQTTNTVTASIPCTVTMKYRPIIKDTL